MNVTQLKAQPINLQQGLLLSSIGQPVAAYDHHNKVIFITDSSVFIFYSVPADMQNYKVSEKYDCFSLGGYNTIKGKSELI